MWYHLTNQWIWEKCIVEKNQVLKHLMQAGQVFLSPQSSSAEIQKAREQAMVILYNGEPDESLNGQQNKMIVNLQSSPISD